MTKDTDELVRRLRNASDTGKPNWWAELIRNAADAIERLDNDNISLQTALAACIDMSSYDMVCEERDKLRSELERLSAGRDAVIEECAKVADDFATRCLSDPGRSVTVYDMGIGAERTGQQIRALKSPPNIKQDGTV